MTTSLSPTNASVTYNPFGNRDSDDSTLSYGDFFPHTTVNMSNPLHRVAKGIALSTAIATTQISTLLFINRPQPTFQIPIESNLSAWQTSQFLLDSEITSTYKIANNDVSKYLELNSDLASILIEIFPLLRSIYPDTEFELSVFIDNEENYQKLFVTALVDTDDYSLLDTQENQVFDRILIPNSDIFNGRVIFSQA